MRRIACTVNGVRREAEVEPRLLLVYFLRENLGLTGTNVGCDTSSCGACTVMMDGQSVKSCTVLAVQADGAEITTIEGLASDGQLHPLQEAFRNNHGLQCGFCTPGMIMAGLGLIESGAGMERGGGPPRPRGQPLPLHRLPEHRQGHPGSGGRDAPGRPGRRPGRVRMTQVAEPEAKRWVGGGLVRKEDPKLITGQGRYTDDIALPGMLWLAFVRSPVAHANIASIDTSAAKELPGVVAVYTGEELASEWAAAMPCAWPISSRTYPGESDRGRARPRPLAGGQGPRPVHGRDRRRGRRRQPRARLRRHRGGRRRL